MEWDEKFVGNIYRDLMLRRVFDAWYRGLLTKKEYEQKVEEITKKTEFED